MAAEDYDLQDYEDQEWDLDDSAGQQEISHDFINGGEKRFAGRVGIDVIEDYISDNYPAGAYRASVASADEETERLFSVKQAEGDITLSAGVDAAGATAEQREMYREIADIFERRFELFVQKNLDYDSSFLSAGKVEQALDSGGGPFDTVEEANLYKLFTRIQDKDQRFYSLAFTDNEYRVGEAAAETAGDAAIWYSGFSKLRWSNRWGTTTTTARTVVKTTRARHTSSTVSPSVSRRSSETKPFYVPLS